MSFGNNISSVNISCPLVATSFGWNTLGNNILWMKHFEQQWPCQQCFCNYHHLYYFCCLSKFSIINIIFIIFIVCTINIIFTYNLCWLYNKHHSCNLYCLCIKHRMYNQHIIYVFFIACIIFISSISSHHYNNLVRNGGFRCNEQFKQQFSKQCKRKRQRQISNGTSPSQQHNTNSS